MQAKRFSKKRSGRKVTILLVAVFLLPALNIYAAETSSGISSKVSAVFDHAYFPTAEKLISGAKESIQLAIFEIRHYPDYPDSPSNQLLQKLVAAAKRGVKVEVCIEQSKGYSQSNSRDNFAVATLLTGTGVKVYLDNPKKTMHAKFLVVDDQLVLLGSTNWAYYSLSGKNREANLLVDSPKIAAQFRSYFEEIKKECSLFSKPFSD